MSKEELDFWRGFRFGVVFLVAFLTVGIIVFSAAVSIAERNIKTEQGQ